jgi:crossover junction endodeoxyribonuclease RuvC
MILKTYIGIDPGLLKTGWAVIRSNGIDIFEYIDSGVFKAVKKESVLLSKRLYDIFNFLMKLIAKYDADSAGIENTYVNSNYASSLKLSHARAAAMIACSANDIDVKEYQAKTVKKIITGHGNASKEQIYNALRFYINNCDNKTLAKLERYNDESDALSIAIAHAVLESRSVD